MLKLDTTTKSTPAENIVRRGFLPQFENSASKRKPIRVLRIAHASLTPALRGRERGIAKTFPQVELEVITPPSWFESGVNVKTVPDDLFPVRTAKTYLS